MLKPRYVQRINDCGLSSIQRSRQRTVLKSCIQALSLIFSFLHYLIFKFTAVFNVNHFFSFNLKEKNVQWLLNMFIRVCTVITIPFSRANHLCSWRGSLRWAMFYRDHGENKWAVYRQMDRQKSMCLLWQQSWGKIKVTYLLLRHLKLILIQKKRQF